MEKCKICGKDFEKGYAGFCSRKCYMDNRYLNYIAMWKDGEVDGGAGNWGDVSDYIRRYLFEKNDNKCSICGWGEVNKFTGKVPLEIDHIDGNPLNHSESNLRLICPNCHALTENYRGRNVKNGETKGRGYKVTHTERTQRDGVRKLNNLKDSVVECKYCHKNFIPRHGKQMFCSDKCSKKYRSDNSARPDKCEIEKLVNDGCSMTYIGSLYGVSTTTVKNWLRKYNLVAKTSFEYKRNNK